MGRLYDPWTGGNTNSVSETCASRRRQQRNVQDRLLAAVQVPQLAERMRGGTAVHEGL